MRKILLYAAVAVLAIGCAPKEKAPGYAVPAPADVVMYQVNPRVFAETNSLQAVIPHLDDIKELGANVVWIMPIYPIGQEKSKNSPYSIADYEAVNPEFGTKEDFRALVDAVHSHGMAFIMDWVANHTAWDSKWIKEGHTDWYTKDSTGAIIHPAGTDWTDVADLDYGSSEMREAMKASMLYWIEEMGVDGFRCDVADQVPADFWEDCIATLREKAGRPILMLAEGHLQENFEAGFDMNYAWDYLAALRDVYVRDSSVTELVSRDAEEYAQIPEGKVKLRFTTNHDEATKLSTIEEFGGRDGALSAWVAAVYVHGAALVYGEQEVGYPETINFFKWVPVDFSANPDIRAEYKNLIRIFKENPAIHGAGYVSHSTDDVLALEKGEGKYLVVVNVRPEVEQFQYPEGWAGQDVTDLASGDKTSIGEEITLEPYQYQIFAK